MYEALKKRFKRIIFDSNIPQGYGVGSSGALVAAIFEKYSFIKYNPEEISKKSIKRFEKSFRRIRVLFSW